MNANVLTPPTTEPAPAAAPALAGKYLTFRLGGESYAIPVLHVREIIQPTTITAVPQMPDAVRGVINLRGKIIPVMDLRRRFNLPAAEATDQTCFVVVQLTANTRAPCLVGFIVDAVEEVLQIAAADIEPAPDFGSNVETGCILGMAKVKGSVKTLLDVARVVGRSNCQGLGPTS